MDIICLNADIAGNEDDEGIAIKLRKLGPKRIGITINKSSRLFIEASIRNIQENTNPSKQ
jgi:hypothetical protein